MLSSERPLERSAWSGLALSCVFALAIVLRAWPGPDVGFWEDEIIAVTHAVQPWTTILQEILRTDIHPPLYFLQLKIWTAFGDSDAVFRLNSLLLSLAAVLSIWKTTRNNSTPDDALANSVAFAVLPAGIWMAHEVRPYAWLSVLQIWSFHWALAVSGPDRPRRWTMLALFLGDAAMIMSHAIGFLFVGVQAIFILLRLAAADRKVRPCLALYTLLGVVALPVLASGLVRDANLSQTLTITGVATMCSDVITASDPQGWTWSAGLMLFAVLLIAGLILVETRLMTICMVCGPLLAAIILALAIKPIFKINVFATMLMPFFAMIGGTLLVRMARRQPLRSLGVAGAVLMFSAVVQAERWTSTHFMRAAVDLRRDARPGDVLYAPQPSMFLGLAWYLAGPHWGSPLQVANPPTGPWPSVYERLGPYWVNRLHLQPVEQSIAVLGGIRLYVGQEARAIVERAPRAWVATYPQGNLPPGFGGPTFGPLVRSDERHYSMLTISLYQ